MLAAATAIGGLGLASGGTAAALLAVEMTGREAAAGLPLGALAAGQAAASLLVARVTGRAGRGAGLVLGYAIGELGALVVVAAALGDSFPVMLAGSLLLGGANAAIFLSRYAAADLAGPDTRGRALGSVLFATALGTVAGPVLLVPTGRLAQALGLPRLAGLYLVSVAAFAAAGLAVTALSRRLPELGRGARVTRVYAGPSTDHARPAGRGAPSGPGASRPAGPRRDQPGHGRDHGGGPGAADAHGTTSASSVSPSASTPWPCRALPATDAGRPDRRRRRAAAVAALLILAGMGGLGHHHGHDIVALLIVLGLGWNCGVVAGATACSRRLSPSPAPA